ncbi:MAG: major Facilitator Superfamily protein [Firmicutes bacterium]|nr:major Facilitator Superfamily protein [Bacillota bacterium]
MKQNKVVLKIAILSGSILVASAAAITANIPHMANAMPSQPLAMVEMLTTISSLFLMAAVLTSDFIARKIGYKLTIMTGLCIVAVSGVLPAVIGNFYIVLVSRAFLGFGIGLFNSLLVVIVNYFYDGNERSSVFGMQSACEGLGGVAVTYIAGQLMGINWQAPFYAYLIAVPSVLLFGYFVPNIPTKIILDKTRGAIKKENIQQTSSNNSFKIAGYMGLIFIIAILYMTMGIKTATLMLNSGYANLKDASLVFSFVGIGAIFSGFLFGRLIEWLKQYTLIVAFFCMALSMFLIGVSNNTFLTVVGGFLLGFGFRVAMPYLINKINTGDIPNKGLATSLLLVGYNLGVFVTPYASLVLQNLIGTNNLRTLFYADGAGFIILAVGALLSVMLQQKDTENTLTENRLIS